MNNQLRRIFYTYLLLPLPLALFGCGSLHPNGIGTSPVSHEILDVLLGKYVDKHGNVDYKGLTDKKADLDRYLALLSENVPNDEHWSQNEQLAYWINAYNAFTLQLILENYPLESIKNIGSKIQIPFVNTPWDLKFIKIGTETFDLNNIEHNILRKNFEEPRIHFAIVCASFSCPKLRMEAYTGARLNQQLTEQTQEFLHDKQKNMIAQNEIRISKIFSWFKGDFTKNGSLIEFLNQYTETQIDAKAKVKYMDYNWELNEQR